MTAVVRLLNRGTRILAKAGSYGSINPKLAHPAPSGHFLFICQVLCSHDGVLSSKVYPIAYEKDRNTSLLKKDLVAQNFEFTFCFVPRVGHVNAFSGPHRRAFAAFR